MISAEKQKNITFLHPYYNYTCAVAAVTVGSGPYSMPITAATSQDSKYYQGSLVKIVMYGPLALPRSIGYP